MMSKIGALLVVICCLGFSDVQAQFGPERILAMGEEETLIPRAVYAADLDGDGDNDVLSASAGDDKIAWYENRGGTFGPQQVISEEADWAISVYAADLDGDADPDVLTASSRDHEIAWYENRGGSFGSQQIISRQALTAGAVYATDLDGDGRQDVLAALQGNDRIVWYKNLGGRFSERRLITEPISNIQGIEAIAVADMDLDGDSDVLAASSRDDKIVWYPNDGGTFGPQQIVTSEAHGAASVAGVDLSGDSDADILVASWGDDTIAWYENLGGTFGPRQIISSEAHGARAVYAADLDLDNDLDVVSASTSDNKIAWYENLAGTFGPENVVSRPFKGAWAVYARDLDGNGSPEILAVASDGNKVAWFENRLATTSTDVESEERLRSYALAPNYPNPFNPITRIAYNLPEPMTVKLSVLDIAGRPLQTLIHQYQPAGRHRVTFDGTDLPSGFYLYRLRAGEHEETRTMLLLK
jgi:hypothetical protein